MCGIAAIVRNAAPFKTQRWPSWSGVGRTAGGDTISENNGCAEDPDFSPIMDALTRRGPDCQDTAFVDAQNGTTVALMAAVLWHRGVQPAKQPALNGQNILLFNGELYDGLELGSLDEVEQESDTVHLLKALGEFSGDGDKMLHFLDQVRGPWSIIYWHQDTQRLYFGRDLLGRRSLQLLAFQNGTTLIASALPSCFGKDVREIAPAGLFYLDVAGDESTWGLLERSSSILPSLSNRQTSRESSMEKNAGVCIKVESMSFIPKRWLRAVRCGSDNKNILDVWTPDKSPVALTIDYCVDLFLCAFSKSIERRLKTSRRDVCLGAETESRFAVLFSGGIDSLFLAVMLDKCLVRAERMDLVNVAFGSEEDVQKCADRQNAESALMELHEHISKSTQRDIRMICADVLPADADRGLYRNVRPLVQPCDQLMDDSIGTALWFAARATGNCVRITDDGSLERSAATVTSTARILFSGLGADELMGGYKGRHRTTFRRDGEQGILREMDADLSRLWYRNLGRDDRVISDSGREVRHPFLDEDLIDIVTKLPLHFVCDLSKPDGVGDKQLLRMAAQRVGLSRDACTRSKRAIQFGSRSKHVLERKRSVHVSAVKFTPKQ